MATAPNITPANGTAIQRRQSFASNAIRGGEIGCFLMLTFGIALFFLCAFVGYIVPHWFGVF